MTFQIEYESRTALDLPYEDIIKKTILAVLDFEDCPYEAEVSVVLTDNDEIQAANKEFRSIDKATDVLSFPMIDFPQPSDFECIEFLPDCVNPDSDELLLGDIMISVEKMIVQADEYGHSIERELAFLIAHSVLHLLGYDHMEEEERIIMEEKQNVILEQMGITRN